MFSRASLLQSVSRASFTLDGDPSEQVHTWARTLLTVWFDQVLQPKPPEGDLSVGNKGQWNPRIARLYQLCGTQPSRLMASGEKMSSGGTGRKKWCVSAAFLVVCVCAAGVTIYVSSRRGRDRGVEEEPKRISAVPAQGAGQVNLRTGGLGKVRIGGNVR